MDQDKSQAGEELTGTADTQAPDDRTPGTAPAAERTPEQVRAEIERTRVELGDTVAALAEKADVKGQAQQAAAEIKTNVTDKVSAVRDTVTGKRDDFVSSARAATPESAADAGRTVGTFAQRSALPLAALAALAIGILVGRRSAR